jgi:hypothetical protein
MAICRLTHAARYPYNLNKLGFQEGFRILVEAEYNGCHISSLLLVLLLLLLCASAANIVCSEVDVFGARNVLLNRLL